MSISSTRGAAQSGGARHRSSYSVWTRLYDAGGTAEVEAVIQPDADPPPVRPGDLRRAAHGLPQPTADRIARGYVALMEHTAAHGPPPAMPPEHAAAILAALLVQGPARGLRRVVRSLGYGGGSRDADRAIGLALRDLGREISPTEPSS